MNPFYPQIAGRAGHRCEYCRAPEGAFNFPFEVEHALPISEGGPTELANLALSCRSCNVHKGARIEAYDEESEASVPLFNPRQHLWNEHFRVELETLVVIGTTPIGRATVAALAINSMPQIAARLAWRKLKLFP